MQLMIVAGVALPVWHTFSKRICSWLRVVGLFSSGLDWLIRSCEPGFRNFQKWIYYTVRGHLVSSITHLKSRDQSFWTFATCWSWLAATSISRLFFFIQLVTLLSSSNHLLFVWLAGFDGWTYICLSNYNEMVFIWEIISVFLIPIYCVLSLACKI